MRRTGGRVSAPGLPELRCRHAHHRLHHRDRPRARTLHGTCYYTAHGATFGALAIASLIPRDSLIEKAFHDGTEAAQEAFNEHESAIVEPSPDIPAAV
jgi:hypothetical protein